MRNYYIDVNAMSHTLGGDSLLPGWTQVGADALRASLAAAIRRGDIAVFGSHFHLEEASRIGDVEKRRRLFNFFWATTGWLLLMPTYKLVKDEVKSGGRLCAYDPFEAVMDRAVMKQRCKNDAKLDELGADVKAYAEKYKRDTEARRIAIATKFSGMTPQEVVKQWWPIVSKDFSEWIQDYLENSKDHLGLSDDRSSWPTPGSQQTAWAMHAYMMARIYMNVGLGRKIGDGDVYDAHHYAGACYADTFVTHDGPMRATLAEIPNQPIEVLDFNQFAARLGVAPH